MAVPRFTWDGTRYRDNQTGRFISPLRVRQILDSTLRRLGQEARTLSNDLRAGRVSRTEWEAEMRAIIKDTHILSGVLARGGFNQMTPQAWGQIGAQVRSQYQYFDGLLRDMDAGRQKLDGSLSRRAESYAKAGIVTAHRAQQQVQRTSGMRRERNVEDPNLPEPAHCTGPNSCRAQTERGWVPIGSLIPIGQRTCLGNCHCHLEFDAGEVEVEVPAEAPVEVPVEAPEPDITARDSAAFPPARPDEAETINRFTRADGTLTPERQALHDAILRQHFANATPVDNPTVFVMGGGPAAGKSVMLGSLDLSENKVTVDPDAIKALLPEYRELTAKGDVNAATVVHEESSALAKRIVAQAAGGRYNVVVDGTGDNSYESLAKKVAGYRAGGAKIVANYVTVDTETAIKRAWERGQKTGRFVPETFIREVHRSVSDVVPKAIQNGLFDELTIWDTNGPGKVIARYRNGRLDIEDVALWERFLAKADPDILRFEGETGTAFKETVRAAVAKLPASAREALARNGVTIRAGRTTTEMFPELAGVTPRGYPEGWTWDNAEGMYNPKHKAVVVTEMISPVPGLPPQLSDRVPGVVTHETGHAVDEALGGEWFDFVSEQPEFQEAYKADTLDRNDWSQEERDLLAYFLQDWHPGRSEAFAEGFAITQGQTTGSPGMVAAFLHRFPRVMALIRQRFG